MSQYQLISLLLVEDDEADIAAVRRCLSQNKLPNPLYIAKDGPAALAMLKAGEDNGTAVIPWPRIVLLDLSLPGMSGLELLQEIRDDVNLSSTMIIVITGSQDERDHATASGLNVASYFVKPVDFDLLIGMIASLERTWNAFMNRQSTDHEQPAGEHRLV